MMDIKLFDTVLLKDGRIGAVVEVNSKDNFDIDVGSSPEDWETLWGVTIDKIEKVIKN